MEDRFEQLIIEFNELVEMNGFEFVINIIQSYCRKHNLHGPDGIAGLSDYIKVIYDRKQLNSDNTSVVKSFGETAYLFWALERLGRRDLIDAVAKQMQSGWDFGETCGYKNEEANYFRSFEIELNVGLRLLEYNLDIKAGGEGEPDYIISSPKLVLEVKAPGSKKGLFQCIIKAVKQIEKYGIKGIVVVALDHMVRRDMIKNPAVNLDDEIVDIICSALPTADKYSTIGVVVEWVDWEDSENRSIVQAIMPTSKKNMHNQELMDLILKAELRKGAEKPEIIFCESQNHFPYDCYELEDINPSSDGEQFYEKYLSKS